MVQASAAGNKPFHNMGEGDADKRPNTRASGDDEVTHATCIGHRQGEAHWIDAACVGESGECVYIAPGHAPLLIKANGRQSRLMCRPDKYGFPRTRAKVGRVQYGFQTGDIVRAVVPKGKHAGTHIGRVAVRSSGYFNITTRAGTVQGIGYRHCTHLHKSDGYSYEKGEAAANFRFDSTR